MTKIEEYIDRIESKVKEILSQYSEIKEENNILKKEIIRLEKVNNQLLKEVEEIKSHNMGLGIQESIGNRSNIKITKIKTELNQCIQELEKCIDLSTRDK